MDSDSSSLTFVAAARDGSPSEEDGSTLLVAKEAAVLFQAGKFDHCVGILGQLLKKKDDPKVRHNIAIAGCLADGSDPRGVIKELENIKKRSEELARASVEHLEVADNNGSKHTAGIVGNNASTHPSTPVIYGDEFDTSVAMFNTAVSWYHLHEYTKSFLYLDALYQNIEPIGEGTAVRICLLLLDVALLSHNASRSADVISYMEKVFSVKSLNNQVDNVTSGLQQSLLISRSRPLPGSSIIPDASQSNSTASTLENSLTRTSSEEALEDESLHLLMSGQSFQRPGTASSSDLSRTQADESLSIADLRLKLHLYKIRFLLLTRNLKASKREVKMAMNIARGKDYPLALCLKSQLEYARGNHRKAIKLLMAANSAEIGFSSIYYNNLGCIYYRLGKHHTSGVFFSKALSNSSLLRKEKPLKLLTFSQDKSLLITYNCGIHSLASGRPFHAARCFQSASLIFYNRPLLWLRIAECCIMALEKGLIKSIQSAPARSDITVNLIGKGKWRHLALRLGNPLNDQKCVGGENLLAAGGKHPDLSISLACQCLVNALYLLDSTEGSRSRSGSSPTSQESESRETPLSQGTNGGDPKESNVAYVSSQVNSNGEVKDVKDHKSGNNQTGSLQNSVIDYEHIRMKENHMIKQATLADLAFVELSLGNPLESLSTAQSLMKFSECSKMYRFLGTVYAAEALCLLNRPKEAADHLMMYISGGNNVELPYSREDCEKWSVDKMVDSDESNAGTVIAPNESRESVFKSPEEARGIFCANYAANFALMGDSEQAQYFLAKALSDIPHSSQVILTAIYLDIKRGKTQEALVKLKQHSGVRFLPSNLTLNGAS